MNIKNFAVSIFRIVQHLVHKFIFSQSTPVAYQISITFSVVFFFTICIACSNEDSISKKNSLETDRLHGIRIDEPLERPNFILQDKFKTKIVSRIISFHDLLIHFRNAIL